MGWGGAIGEILLDPTPLGNDDEPAPPKAGPGLPEDYPHPDAPSPYPNWHYQPGPPPRPQDSFWNWPQGLYGAGKEVLDGMFPPSEDRPHEPEGLGLYMAEHPLHTKAPFRIRDDHNHPPGPEVDVGEGAVGEAGGLA